ncbi:replication initiator protein [Saccharopolyspora sp. HNM0986]|uniref:replication initiator n=1 Tax=Saccharopolyspora galaxeae TaxID=2781241 RepID=UPI00190BED38|nr:replication initiator [Saccharopolyspora sp. HNM0986]MBK0865415.1 replication initiator protein [Saccharopolyspora sp. HNM0986]
MLRGPSGLSVAQAAAENEHVCTRPMAMRRTDTDTGSSRVVAVACGATREAVCGPCARRHRRLRVEQCRQGWHLEAEPDTGRREPDREQTALMGYRADLLTLGREALEANEPGHVADVREALAEVDGALRDAGVTSRLPGFDEIEHPAPSHRGRSTRRRADIPDLPRRPVRGETIGQTYAGGRYRPSLFATLTLPSYGPVHSARWRGGRIVRCGCGQTHRPDSPVLGTPVDPDSYDYARAARDAIHFSSLVDRFWQNLRRAVGWNVQYFAAVEPQKRLTPHLHTAIRGTVPRALLGQVVAGTYHHVWWPQHDHPVYGGERLPVWNPDASAWCDPDTRRALPTWEESLPVPDAEPADAAHTVRFGAQTDVRGVLGGSTEAERHTRYLTKYLTKSVGETHTATHSAQREHARRLLDALAVTPCSPRCGVWLLYGIQPRGASSRTHPGQCRGKAHQPHALGVAGRRVLVSRAWTGKTLPQHAETRRAHVRATLTAGGVLPEGGDQPARSFGNSGERASPGATWERIRPGDSDVPPRPLLILDSIARRRRSRADYQAAQHALALTDDAADGGV